VRAWRSCLAGIQRWREPEPPALVAPDRPIVCDGRHVDLTKLEFEVISYLYQRKGTVVERSALLRLRSPR